MYQTVLICNCPLIAFYFLCQQKIFFVDQAIIAPDHGKDLLNGLNPCDKQHQKLYMKQINHTHQADNDINDKLYLIYVHIYIYN